jgi:hypothetical protein
MDSEVVTDAHAVVGIAQTVKDEVAIALHRLVRLAVVLGLVAVLMLAAGLAANIGALVQNHEGQVNGHKTSLAIQRTVDGHNVLLTETLGAACVLIQSSPTLTLPPACVPLLKKLAVQK